MKEVVTKKADDGTTIINEYDTKWIQKDGKDIGKIIKDGKTVFEAWDLARWKQYLQNNEGSIPDGLATPYALQKATSVAGLFSDNSSKFYTGSFPKWKFENATSLADFNRRNTNTTGHVIIDAPKCTSFSYAFAGCTGIESIEFKAYDSRGSWDHAFNGCSGLTLGNIELTGSNFNACFAKVTIGGNITINLKNTSGQTTYLMFSDAKIADSINIVINQAPDSNNGTWRGAFGFTGLSATHKINSIVINGMKLTGESPYFGAPFCRHATYNFAPFEFSRVNDFQGVNSGGASNEPKNFTYHLNFPSGMTFGNYYFNRFDFSGSHLMDFYSSNLRIKAVRISWTFTGTNLTQLDFDYSKSTNIDGVFSGNTKFDLESVQKMAGVKNDKVDYSAIGFPVTSTAKTLNIGIAARRLYKKFDPKYDRYDTGKTQYDANGNILYLKADGTTTTTASQAPLNNYIINSPGDRIDITTVEDTHTITNYNNYYLYVASLQYITGDMLEAVRALMDKGYTVTVKFN